MKPRIAFLLFLGVLVHISFSQEPVPNFGSTSEFLKGLEEMPETTKASHQPIVQQQSNDQEKKVEAKKVPQSSGDAFQKQRKHIVESGENPWTIAKKYGVPMEELIDANKIEDTRNLKVGQELNIPSMAPSPPANETREETSVEKADDFNPEGYEVYTIKKGDNPWTVARRLKIDYQSFLDLNQIENPRDLKIGQKLMIPPKGESIGEEKVVEPSFDADGHEVYVIKFGDNPWTVARSLKVDYNELIQLNGIENPRKLKIGQKLKIPK